MGVSSARGTRKNRRRFGRAGGRHSHKVKKRQKTEMKKIQERVPFLVEDEGDESQAVSSKTYIERKQRTSHQCVQVDPPQIDHENISKTVVHQPSTSSENVSVSRWTGQVNFVGRKILHEFCIENKRKRKSKWYSGTVLDVVKGKDGDPKSVYEVKYEGEDDPKEVDHLHSDFIKGTLIFSDT